MDAAKVGHLIIGGKILQRGVYQENSGTSKYDRNAWKYDPLNLPTLSSLNPSTNPLISYLFGEIKRGKDGNYYIPQMSAIDKIHSYSANGVNPDVSLAATGYQMASSWPTQVYKVFEDPALTLSEYGRTVGNKSYELKDHLGNVRVVISDVKLGQDNTGADDIMDEFVPEVKSYSDYYAGGMLMPERQYNAGDYRYGHNTQEKVDEVSGIGNHYTAQFWEYDSRIIRRWNLDPVVKPWESGYAAFGNKPIWFSDPVGLDVINAHKESRDKAKIKLDAAKEKFAQFKKGDEGRRAARKELRQARGEFRDINAKYQRVESKIREIKEKDPELFDKAHNLTDPGGTKIDIYVYDTPHDILQARVKTGMVKYGDTDAFPGTAVSSYDGSTPEYTRVQSEKHGENTITVRVSDIAKVIHLAHEFGHAIFQGKYMKQYMEWLEANPKEQGKGGHGNDDPSGKAAEEAEGKFK